MTLAQAVEWVHEHLDDEEPPRKLHHMRTETQGELGTPEMTAAFIRWLAASPYDTMMVTETRRCHHPRAVHGRCGDCEGSDLFEVRVERYRRPMRAALEHLGRNPGRWPEHEIPPFHVLRVAFLCGLNTHRTALALHLGHDHAEAVVLMALRRLHGRFRLAPYPRQRKSEAQLDAEHARA